MGEVHTFLEEERLCSMASRAGTAVSMRPSPAPLSLTGHLSDELADCVQSGCVGVNIFLMLTETRKNIFLQKPPSSAASRMSSAL